MATYTTYYNLKKPEATDTSEIIGDLNLNWDGIDTYLYQKADKVPGAVAGNLASLDATGNLQDSGKNTDDFAPATHVTDATKHIQEALTGKAGYVVTVNDTEDGLELRKAQFGILTFDAGLPHWG